MRYYMVTQEQLEALASGKEQVRDIAVPEHRVLDTWSGEDVIDLVKEKISISPPDFDMEACIDYVVDYLANEEIGHYISEAINEFLKEQEI